MEKIKQYKYIIALTLVILGAIFYWYEYRTMRIKENCSTEAHFDAVNKLDLSAFGGDSRQDLIDNYYNDCLMRFGLK